MTPAHAEALFAGLRDEQLYEFIDDEPPASASTLRSRLEKWAAGKSPDGSEAWLNWAVRVGDTGRYVGTVQATLKSDFSAELAFLLFSDARGNGYASEAVAATIAHLREHDLVSRFEARVDPSNLRSVRLLRALGFERTDTPSVAVTIRGVPAGEVQYALVIR